MTSWTETVDEREQPASEDCTTPPHYIAAPASTSQPGAATLKHGDTFAVFDVRGDITGAAQSTEGVYHRDTRILSQLSLTLEGCPPVLLSSVTRDDNAVFIADLTNPDLLAQGKIALRRERIHVQRTKFLWNGACYERLVVRNYTDATRRVRINLHFACDFADLFEVRGEVRKRRGTMLPEKIVDGQLLLRYFGVDEVERTTAFGFSPQPDFLNGSVARFELPLAPNEARRIFLRIGLPVEGERRAPLNWNGHRFYADMRAARRALHQARARGAKIDSSNAVFNEVTRRSESDLYMLITDLPQGPYPYAGTPWFSTPFGRDGLITALMMLWYDPAVAKGVLGFLAATQADAVDPARDAEPGKILHEMRHGEMAHLHEVPFGRYYGSIDSTPLFVFLMGEYFVRTGDIETLSRLWPNVEAALAWIDDYGDADGDGFVEYSRKNTDGLINQGWKDSQDAVFHASGKMAEPPIALCEVQAYVYGAKRHAATMARALGHAARANVLKKQADQLRIAFEAHFWCEELSTYAIALDGEKVPCRVVASNAGQVLLTGIAAPERARRVAATLFEPANFSGWGIRTLAHSAPRYNPMSYHNGSIWPHDNALIALGLQRYGMKEEVLAIFKGLYEAATYMDSRRLPELFCGFLRERRIAPTLYPVACTPQAWASAAMLALIQASVGLEIREDAGEIVFDHPVLPRFLDELHLCGLTLRAGSADVSFRRIGDDVAVSVTRSHPGIRILARH
ncbi:MAG: amylo-alpha-1,6-glucosidase [Burkholderiaceae bacterium]